MITLDTLSKYISNDMLQTIYESREHEIYELKSKENPQRNKILIDNPTDYEKLLVIIKNLPPHFHNTRESIIKTLEEYVNRENALAAYDNEKFYKNR